MLTCDTKWKWKKKKMQKRSFEPKDLMMYLKGNSGPYIRERRRFFFWNVVWRNNLSHKCRHTCETITTETYYVMITMITKIYIINFYWKFYDVLNFRVNEKNLFLKISVKNLWRSRSQRLRGRSPLFLGLVKKIYF